MKRPTRREVAKLAGVSVATVSYVVNNGPRPVSEETRERVLTAIEELGYKPSAIARSLKTGNTQTVGVIVPSLVAGFFGYLVTELEVQLAERGYSLILASSSEDCEREKNLLNVLADRSIDGLLYVPISAENCDDVKQLIESGIPVVFIDRYKPGVQADAVMTDNVKAAKRATNHLIQSGCQRIVCISFHHQASSALERIDGYRQALQDNDLPIDQKMILHAMWPFGESVEDALLAHIESHGIPDGIFCTVEGHLGIVIKALRELGIRVPNQVQVSGGFTASTSPWNELMDIPIPIVRQNYQLIAQRAVELLMDRINGDDLPLHTELIEAEYIE